MPTVPLASIPLTCIYDRILVFPARTRMRPNAAERLLQPPTNEMRMGRKRRLRILRKCVVETTTFDSGRAFHARPQGKAWPIRTFRHRRMLSVIHVPNPAWPAARHISVPHLHIILNYPPPALPTRNNSNRIGLRYPFPIL